MPWSGKLEQLFPNDAQRGMKLMLGRRKKKKSISWSVSLRNAGLIKVEPVSFL